MIQAYAHRRRVAVYCGSACGSNPAYMAEATGVGQAIAAAGLGLVYGGAGVGLMGAVANAALSAGAEVIGVLPEILSGKEIAHSGLTSLELVPTMHERKDSTGRRLPDSAGRLRNVRRVDGSRHLGAVRIARETLHSY